MRSAVTETCSSGGSQGGESIDFDFITVPLRNKFTIKSINVLYFRSLVGFCSELQVYGVGLRGLRLSGFRLLGLSVCL